MKATKELAKSTKIPVFDSWKLFSRYERKMDKRIDSLLLDGMHPNETGHTIIANAISKIIINSTISKEDNKK